MTPTKLLAVAAVGLSAAACSYSNTTTATAPPPAAVVAPAGTVVVSQQLATGLRGLRLHAGYGVV